MPASRLLVLFALLLAGCQAGRENAAPDPAGPGACESDTTTAHQTVRGALLGTRFASLDELKTVIRIEYGRNSVRVRHCSQGQEVMSVLSTGASQGDLVKARDRRAIGSRLSLLFRCPYAIVRRHDLERAFILSRWRPEEGDVAFFDIAKASVANINTPELAFRLPKDTTEKGYLNSFNHITAQAFLTSCFSEELADFIADAHERYRHPELITGQFTHEQLADLAEGPVDNYVDIINNEWGQELGKQLKTKYGIRRETVWTPELLAAYLNDLQSYYSWAFQIGFEPYRPEDVEVQRFAKKINDLLQG